MKRAIVLLSGGQDSTTCLYRTLEQRVEVIALSLWYGQRHVSELEASAKIAKLAQVPHRSFALSFMADLADSALLGKGLEIKGTGGRPDIEMPEGLPTSYVPARNILLLSVAAAVAVKEGADAVVTGVCQTDYSGYPDCRKVFIDAMQNALDTGLPSSARVRLYAPLMHLTKAETVRMAKGIPGCWAALAHTVTCYNGERPGCGECPSCKLRAKGFAEAGESDPAG